MYNPLVSPLGRINALPRNRNTPLQGSIPVAGERHWQHLAKQRQERTGIGCWHVAQIANESCFAAGFFTRRLDCVFQRSRRLILRALRTTGWVAALALLEFAHVCIPPVIYSPLSGQQT